MKKIGKKGLSFDLAFATSQGGGQQIIMAVVSSYISVFFTDYVGIAAAVAGVIMAVATLWDAISNLAIGVLVDQTHSKYGRYRPYFLWVPGTFGIISCLLFANFQMPYIVKVIWCLVFYILWGMSLSVLTIANHSILPAHTKETSRRNRCVTIGAIMMSIAFTVGSSFAKEISDKIGSWVPFMAVAAVLTVVSFLWLFKASKETYIIEGKKKTILKELKTLLKHKEVYPVLIIFLCTSLGFGLMFTSSAYYVMYVSGRPEMVSLYMLVLSIGGVVSNMVVMPIVLKKFKYAHKALPFCLIITVILYMLCFFFGSKNIILLMVTSFFATSFATLQNPIQALFSNDLIDFIQLKDGTSMNGTVSALRGFAGKCGATLNSSGMLFVLSATGYVANAFGNQPQVVLTAINWMRFLVPSILAVIVIFICKFFYPFEKHYGEIEKMHDAMTN